MIFFKSLKIAFLLPVTVLSNNAISKESPPIRYEVNTFQKVYFL